MPDSTTNDSTDRSPLTLTWPWLPVVNPDASSSPPIGHASLLWHGKGEALVHGERTVPKPLVYGALDVPEIAEPSCINTDLETEARISTEDTELGSWPDYATMSPSQRNGYLDWLAGDRKTSIKDDGYLFLFLYGLERRVLVDGADHETILRELLTLTTRYKGSTTFYNAASHFIAFVFATVKIRRIREYWFKRLFLSSTANLHDEALRVALTWLYQHNNPIPGVLAYQVALRDIRCRKGPTFHGAEKKVRRSFLKRYATAFPGGIPLGKTGATHEYSYRPLNPSLQGWRAAETLHSVVLPDVLGATELFAPIVSVWNECLEALNPDPSSRDSSNSEKWSAIVSNGSCDLDHARTSIGAIAEALSITPAFRSSLSMEQSLSLIDAALAVNLSIEPHPLVLFRPFRTSDRVVVVSVDHKPNDESEDYYLAASLLLSLGIGMAAADGHIDRCETLHVSAIANAQFHFSDDDRRRITAYGALLLAHPPELVPLATRIRRELPEAIRKPLGNYLIEIAASNGTIEDSERVAITSVFRAFDIPEGPLEAAPGGADAVAETLGDAYRRIRSAAQPEKRRTRVPKVGTSSLTLAPELSLEHQFENYKEAGAIQHTIRVSESQTE